MKNRFWSFVVGAIATGLIGYGVGAIATYQWGIEYRDDNGNPPPPALIQLMLPISAGSGMVAALLAYGIGGWVCSNIYLQTAATNSITLYLLKKALRLEDSRTVLFLESEIKEGLGNEQPRD